jgi:nicotinate-nucleotide pyrophosphorylase
MERENSFSQAMLADAIKTNITSALKEDLGKSDLTSNLLKKISRVRFRLKQRKKGYCAEKHGSMNALSK